MKNNALTMLMAATLAAFAVGAQAQTVVNLNSGRLSLVTPNGDQTVKVEIGPSVGEARVFGFPGVADGAHYLGVTGLTVVTGAGADTVEVLVNSPQSLDVQIDTQGGEGQASVVWSVPAGAAGINASLQLDATGGTMKSASIEAISQVNDARFTIDTGAAAEVTAKVVSPSESNFLGVVFMGSAVKSTLAVESSARSLELNVTGGNITAANELKYQVSQNVPAAVSTRWNIVSGAGADLIEATVAAPGSTVTQRGTVRTQGGADYIKFETEGFSTTTGLTLNGGDGNDVVAQIIKGRFQMSQTLQTRLFGATGDDQLILTTDTGIYGTGIPNDLNPIIDCGLGTDQFNGFGIIRSCESRL